MSSVNCFAGLSEVIGLSSRSINDLADVTLAVNTIGLSFVLDPFIGELHNLIFDGICYRFYLALHSSSLARPIMNHTVPFPKVKSPGWHAAHIQPANKRGADQAVRPSALHTDSNY